MKEKKERKQFEIGLLIWYFKYWYSLNLKSLTNDFSKFAKKDIEFIEKYIKPYILLIEAENNRQLIKKELSQYPIHGLPLSKLDEFRNIEKWQRSSKEEVFKLYSTYRLMIHSSVEDITIGIKKSIGRESVKFYLKKLISNNIITCFHGVHREKNKNSYLYNPKLLNDYIKENYLSVKTELNDYFEQISINQLKSKGYQIIPPKSKKENNSDFKQKQKKQNSNSSNIHLESSWDGFLDWVKHNLTKESLSAMTHFLTPVKDFGSSIELKVSGDISQFHKQVIVRYFSDNANPKKEVKFI